MDEKKLAKVAVEKAISYLQVPSVGGDTNRLREILWEEMGAWEANSEGRFSRHRTNKGLIYGTLRGKNDAKHRLVTAHIDTLGAMVQDIKENGRLRLSQVGGYAWPAVEGENVTIFTGSGKTYTGSFLPDKASVHIFRDEARETPRTEFTMEVRIDAPTSSRAETEALGIHVGDVVAYDTRTVYDAQSGYLKSRYLDDKAIVAVQMVVMQDLIERRVELPYTTHFFFSDYEEVGHGIYGIPVECFEFLAMDIGTVGGTHTSSEHKVTILAKDSRTPYNVDFRRYLERLARREGIAYATDVHYQYGSDATAVIFQGLDAAFACIGLGVDATHHYERAHIDGFAANIALLTAYLQEPALGD